MKITFGKNPPIVLTYFLRALFLIAAIYALYTGDTKHAAIAFISLLLTLIPSFFSKNFHVTLPPTYQIVLLLFIFFAQFLGELNNYYERFWWWDLLLHTSSGVLLGFIGLLLVYILNSVDKIHLALSPIFIAIFGFSFAITCGALWEIFEFSVDLIFGTNMQKSGLIDTMGDLIVDTIGALIASITGFIHLKRKSTSNWMAKQIKNFIEMNPKFRNKV